jgi:3-hydroxybutyryl-CoA dehydratase
MLVDEPRPGKRKMNGEPPYIFVDVQAWPRKCLRGKKEASLPITFLNYLEDMIVGQTASYAKAFSENDLLLFAEASHDDNPVHLDEEFARTTPFAGRVVHGMLTASLISTVLAKALPGPGCIYMTQNLRFCRPVRIGETVTATVTVRTIDYEENRILADTICKVGDRLVLEGTALFMAERRPSPIESGA